MKRQANERSVLLIGGPDAGKSNFLFRVWLSIDNKTGALRADGTPNDLEYLKTGAERLLGGEFAAKTSIEVHNQSIIPVHYMINSETTRGTLVVPDCPGEQWLGIYKKRQWSNDWDDLISEGCGCLIFVRADSNQIVAPYDWISYHKQFGTVNIPAQVKDGEQAEAKTLEPAGALKAAQTPTQVVMVDWLQCLRRAFTAKVGGRFNLRVGIVIAAWDSLPADQQTKRPVEWLESNFPLLAQFVESNGDRYHFEIFGVSIVGGDLKGDPKFRTEYTKGDPTKAGYVVFDFNGTAQQNPDLTLPVAWAMGLEKESFPGIYDKQ